MTDLTPKQEATEHAVTMSNQLARCAQDLNLPEKRLIALGLSVTDSVPVIGLMNATNSGWKMRVTAVQYANMFGMSQNNAYVQMKEAAENLFERHVSYQILTRRGRPITKRIRWVSSATYTSGEGYVELNFTPEIAPHLLGLRSHFTTYKLKDAASFDSIYAWRLFELLKSWESTGFCTVLIEDFWSLMDAPPSFRADFKALRVRLIEPSVVALQEKAGMAIEWKRLIAGGKRVSGLEFRFSFV